MKGFHETDHAELYDSTRNPVQIDSLSEFHLHEGDGREVTVGEKRVPLYVAHLVEFVRNVIGRGGRKGGAQDVISQFSGLTSGKGLFTLWGKGANDGEVRDSLGIGDIKGLKLPVINDPSLLAKFAKIEEVDGKPISIEIPAFFTIHAINIFLKSKYGPDFEVPFDVTTDQSSSVGANLATGAHGETREALPALAALFVDGDGDVAELDGSQLYAAFGTQGFGGIVGRIKLEVSQVPKNEELWILPLVGNVPGNETPGERDAYLDGVPDVTVAMWRHMYHRRLNDHPWVTSADILDRSGLALVAEHGSGAAQEQARTMLQSVLTGDSHAALMMKVRHGGSGRLADSGDPLVDEILMQQLHGGGVIGDNIVLLSDLDGADSRKMHELREMREAVPAIGRELYAQKGPNQSHDTEGGIRITDPRGLDNGALDGFLRGLRAGVRALMAPTTEILKKARESGLHGYDNGHALLVEPERMNGRFVPHPLLTGRGNRHPRIGSDSPEAKAFIASLHEVAEKAAISLHGEKIGSNGEIVVSNGEKHDSENRLQEHVERTDLALASSQHRFIRGGGKTFGFRMGPRLRSRVEGKTSVTASKSIEKRIGA